MLLAIKNNLHWLSPAPGLEECLARLEEDRPLQELWEGLIRLHGDPANPVAGFQLAVDILRQHELEVRPAHQLSQWHVSGIETTDYLLGLLDYLCGLHPILADKITNKALAPDRLIERGTHLDCVLVLQNLSALGSTDADYLLWLDHLLLRQYAQDNIRRHCPLVISSEDSLFFKKEMLLMGHFRDQSL
jgi:hypothetical protein